MGKYPKRIQREFKRLIGQAYENELARELKDLARRFDDWRAGKIDAGDLAELVHQFHDGPARELGERYNSRFINLLVASAVVEGILQREDVSEEAWPYVEEAIKLQRLD